MPTSSDPASASPPFAKGTRRGRLCGDVPPAQVVRYLVVGVWNTLFGYCAYALLTYLLTGLMPCAYMAAGLLSSVVSITVSYLGYKVFVFKTKGNYLREYIRCYLVYGTATLVNLALLPILVFALDRFISPQEYVPYIAGAVLTAGNVIVSFFGHKGFTFADRQRGQDDTEAVGEH